MMCSEQHEKRIERLSINAEDLQLRCFILATEEAEAAAWYSIVVEDARKITSMFTHFCLVTALSVESVVLQCI